MQAVNLSFEYGDQVILKDVNFVISAKDKVGLVGANGAGKTTFFKLLLGKLSPTSGEIVTKKGTRIEWLPQIIAEDFFEKNLTVKEYILAARPIALYEKQLDEIYLKLQNSGEEQEQSILIKEAAEVQDKLEKLDWYEAESIMLNIAYNMGLTDQMLELKVKDLSGGQKSKVAFAKLLYSKQDIMLLDEPTNHLDNDTKRFVIDFLKSYKGSVLIISHDVEFLNEVTNVTLFFDSRTHKIVKYNGNYSVFETLSKEYEERIVSEAKKQEREIEKLKSVIERLEGTSGKRKKLAQDREKKLDKILQDRIVVEPKKVAVDFRIQQDRTENNIPISIRKVSFKYPGTERDIISKLSIEIKKGERFLIVGANGAGKSTLLKLISGELVLNGGEVVLGTKVDLGYYAQEHENLQLEKSILENFASLDIAEKTLRSKLSHFLFYGDDVYKKLKVLSPGERARVALAKLAMSGCNTILLDEPTNHLDPETQEIIAKVFKEFTGTIVVVSHNPSFVNSLGIERMLVLPEGTILPYNKKTVEKFYKINVEEVDRKNKM